MKKRCVPAMVDEVSNEDLRGMARTAFPAPLHNADREAVGEATVADAELVVEEYIKPARPG